MPCPICGGTRHLLHHDLTRARLICRDCGHLNPWMDEPQWRALVATACDILRGIPLVLQELADDEAAEADKAA